MIADPPSAGFAGLPKELCVFHRLSNSLPSETSVGRFTVTYRPFNELALEPIEIEPCVADFFLPRSDSVTVSAVPCSAVVLATISAGEYDTYRLLLWVPDIERYAIWNSLDHSIRLFESRVAWQDIIATPEQALFGKAEGELHVAPDYGSTIENTRAVQRQLMITSLLRFRRPRIRDLASSAVAVVSLLGIGFMVLTSELPAISPETFDQIEIGMKEHEVMRIVRGTPGWYSGPNYLNGQLRFDERDDWPYESNTLLKGFVRTRKQYVWASKDGKLTVDFDGNGAVSYVILEYPAGRQSTHPERWPLWRRLVNRETPGREPAMFFISM